MSVHHRLPCVSVTPPEKSVSSQATRPTASCVGSDSLRVWLHGSVPKQQHKNSYQQRYLDHLSPPIRNCRVIHRNVARLACPLAPPSRRHAFPPSRADYIPSPITIRQSPDVAPLDPPSIGGARQALALRHLCFPSDKGPVADRYDGGKPVLEYLAAGRVELKRTGLGER